MHVQLKHLLHLWRNYINHRVRKIFAISNRIDSVDERKSLPIAANKEAADRNLLPRLAIGDTVSPRENHSCFFLRTGDGRYNLIKKKRNERGIWLEKTNILMLLIKPHIALSFCSLVDQISSTNISFICDKIKLNLFHLYWIW